MPYREDRRQPQDAYVTVATYSAPHEAHLAVLHLENLGIAARTQNEMIVGMAPHLGEGMGGIRVLVFESQAIEAHQALENLRKEIAQAQSERERRSSALSRKRASKLPPFMLLWLFTGALALWYWLQQR